MNFETNKLIREFHESHKGRRQDQVTIPEYLYDIILHIKIKSTPQSKWSIFGYNLRKQFGPLVMMYTL